MPPVMVRTRLLPAALALLFATAGCGDDGGGDPGDGGAGGGGGGAAPGRALVWAVGDAADPGDDDTPVARMIVRSEPDHLLYLGDVYESGTRREFAEYYDPLYGALASRTSPVVGNHEHPNRETGYEPYWREKLGRRLPPWYAVRVGDWEFLALDSELPHDEGSEQLRWLRDHLRGGPRTTCRMAFWHRPRFSAGRHGDQPDMAPVWDALRRRARIVLNGHDHNSQRLRRRDGITTLIAGAGGRSLYGLDERDARLVWADEDHDAALRLVLTRGRARFAFVATDGRVLHRGSVRCRPLR